MLCSLSLSLPPSLPPSLSLSRSIDRSIVRQTIQWSRLQITMNKHTKCLKIPEECSETVNWRKTDNTMATRYQRSNQKPWIEERQTIQCPKGRTQTTNIRNVWRYYRVFRVRKSKKDRQCHGQRKNDKGTKMLYKTLHRKLKMKQQGSH